jgi:hypothetical protein
MTLSTFFLDKIVPSREGIVKCWNMSRNGNVHWLCHVPYRVLLPNTKESEEYMHMHISVPIQSFTMDPIELSAVCEGILAQYMAGCCGTEEHTSKSGSYVC